MPDDKEGASEEKALERAEELIAAFEEDMQHRPLPAEAEAQPAVNAPEPVAPVPEPEPVAANPEPVAADPEPPLEPVAAEPEPVEGEPEPVAPDLRPEPSAPPAEISWPADIAGWWAAGERVEAVGRTIFTRVIGEGPWLTCIHGFPTSSWDWVPVARELVKSRKLLLLDLLGFGDSDKPSGHDWSAFEQADIVEALWKRFDVTETSILAHDVGDTVTLELIARQEEGKLASRLRHVTFLNGGIYTGFHRPRRIQVLLQRPLIGGLIARMLSEDRFNQALAEIFAAEHQPTPEELHQHWLSVAKRHGGRNYHHLIKYIPERREQAPRWESALEKTSIPLKFVWGMADPVSGAQMAEAITERRPGADIVELSDVGHYPQLEAPDRVVAALQSIKEV